MIRALLKKQLLELGAAFVRSSKTGKRRSRAGTVGYALLFAVLMLLVMLSFGSMALPMAITLVPQGLDWLYFVLMELSALTVSVLASAFTSYGHLFRCRDNQQLLALPIPPGAIFAVRCGGVYLTGLIYLLLAWVPSVVCYALAAPNPGGALLAALPVALALAGVSMVLAVLLGWAVALLNRRARHKSLVTVVGTLLFLAVYYAVFQWVGNAVDALALDAVQAAAGRAAAPLRLLGLAAVGNVPALLLFLALAAACMAFCGKALAKPYLRLLTLEPGRVKAEYRAKTQKKQPPRRALLRRELLHLGACPMWLLNCALSSLLLPVLGAATLWKAADLRAFTAAYPPESLPMLVCGMVCTIAAMNFITAPSVSLEGGTLWLLQSLPVTPQQVLRAKVELQLLLTLPAAWLCAGCAMAALRIPAGQGLPVLAVLTAFVWLTAQMDLALGLCLPNVHWVSEAAVVKRSAASMLAMFGGWLLAGGVLFLPLTLLDYAVPPLAAQAICLAVLLGLDLLLHRWLCTRGAARFAALH
jgi:ABC-2 type transport system permease protein